MENFNDSPRPSSAFYDSALKTLVEKSNRLQERSLQLYTEGQTLHKHLSELGKDFDRLTVNLGIEGLLTQKTE